MWKKTNEIVSPGSDQNVGRELFCFFLSEVFFDARTSGDEENGY